MASTWEQKGAEARKALLAKIPKEWHMDPAVLSNLPSNVHPIFASSGILSEKELEITTVKDATLLLEKMHSGTWSSYEVTLAFCKRAAMAHQMLRCLVDIDIEGALKRARELDEHLQKTGKVVGPLHGLPVSLKDLTSVKGMNLTLGFAKFAHNISEEDAVTVQSLRDAGIVVYVKTTMPQTGFALETLSPLWGRTLNSFNKYLSAGGSSGGESSLNGCFGAPLGIGTDIGGSIRAPAAFNGLYGIRPTSRRLSYAGNLSASIGQNAILAVIGPIARSIRDLHLVTKTVCLDQQWLKDPVVVNKPWVDVEVPKRLTIGVMYWDEVVMPHPPIQRALKESVKKLRAAGHEVVEYKPYKHDYAFEVTTGIYFPTAGKEFRDAMAETGEPFIPCVEKFLARSKPLTTAEFLTFQVKQRQYQTEYLRHWNETASLTSTGKSIDAILAPSAACASFPHDFYLWWGYLSQWNILDYPTVIIPTGTVDAKVDVKDTSYTPAPGFDKENYDIYDPALYDGMPVSLQLIGRPMGEEKILAAAEAVDQALKM